VAGLGAHDEPGAEALRVRLAEALVDVRVLPAPHHEGRDAAQRGEVRTGLGQALGRRRAVQPQDGALRALVPVRGGLGAEAPGQRPAQTAPAVSPTATSPTPGVRHSRAHRCQA
jgi:hypothetical protein